MRIVCVLAALLILAACDSMPGRPTARDEVPRPDQILDFTTLYKDNCSGCHGADGKGGASIALHDPIYLAVADDTVIRTVTSAGVSRTQMPPFAQSKGGMLTDRQIDALVKGIRSWAPPDSPRGGIPPYAAESPGDSQRGAAVYATYCSSCHGPDGRGGPKGSSIANPTYLALVSNQYLRTIAIAGRPELGAPDWRSNVPGHPMSDQEIGDVVSWLVSQR